MNSKLWSLEGKDFLKGVFLAVLTGFFTPVVLVVQAPDFTFANANWPLIFNLALNSGGVAFVSYLFKNFISNEEGKVLGRWG